mmetsp:Transcript_86068/g.200123  ORF Transcript_86068/g.200123 Transcript_86068/m.200123 type:complete len:477 (-) Transcript_86068:62-1492(-)
MVVSLRSKNLVPTDAIEELGVGPAQWRVAILCGLSSFSVGSFMMVLSSVNGVLAQEWHLSPAKCGAMASVVFVGICVGTLLGGLAGDRFGRKLPIVASSGSVFVLCHLCLLSSGFWAFVAFLVVLGVAFGFGHPAATTMVSETTPGSWRITFTIVFVAFFTVGEIYSSLLLMLDDATLVHLHWRVMVAVSAAPSAAFSLLIGYFLYQSPVYLASRGRHEEAAQVLELMRKQNGLSGGSTMLPSQPNPTEITLGRQLEVIFGRRLLSTTCISCYLAFVMNVSYYGGFYAFPKIVVSDDTNRVGVPAVDLMLGAFGEIVGYIVGALCIGLPRIQLMLVFFGLQGVCSAAFATSVSGTGWTSQAVMFVGFQGTKVCSSVVFITVYVYAAEVYPTMARALGGSLVASSGRIGAILGPPAVELMFSLWDYGVFFWFAALLSFAALPCLLVLPFETMGRGLLDDDRARAAPYGATGDSTGGA